MMILHGQAVMRGAPRACVVVDMPFGSYEASPEHAMKNAVRIMQETGCAAVKMEGGLEMAPTVLGLLGVPAGPWMGITFNTARLPRAPAAIPQFFNCPLYNTASLAKPEEIP